MSNMSLVDRFNEFSHGCVFIPILIKMKPVLELLMRERTISFSRLCQRFEANPGPLRSILHSLQGMGIIEILEEEVCFKGASDEFLFIPDQIFDLYSIPLLEYLESSSVPQFAPFFAMMEQKWPSIQSTYLKSFLEGSIVLPLITALFQKRFSNQVLGDQVSLEGLSFVAREEILFIFTRYGFISRCIDNQIILTDEGKSIYHRILNYSLGLSYRPMLRELDTLLFGDVKVVFESVDGKERHVDRSLNVLSSGSMHKSYFRRIFPIISEIFNSDCMKTQPAYIVDTGCGDGTFLSELYLHIVNHTVRGTQLDDFPLLMVGVDFNRAALEETNKRLTLLNIPHLTLYGDIGEPSQILKDLSRQGLDLQQRILHIRSFLDHDRPYKPPLNIQKELLRESENVWMTLEGSLISSVCVEESLKNFLEDWRKILKPQDDLMILEVHNLSPIRAFEERHQSISLYFDLLQSLSGQLLVPAETFFRCAAAAGLLSKNCIRFPEDQLFTRIAFHHFFSTGYRIRGLEKQDEKSVAQLAFENRKGLGPSFLHWLSNELKNKQCGHFVMEQIEPESKGALVGVAYLSPIRFLDEIPEFSSVRSSIEGKYLHILDLHTSLQDPEINRFNLFSFVFTLASLQGKFSDLTYRTRAFPQRVAQSPQEHLQQLLLNQDIEVSSLSCFAPRAEKWSPACDGFKRLILKFPFLLEELSEQKKKIFSKEEIIEIMQEEFLSLFPYSSVLSPDSSLLGLGLDSLELGQFVRRISKKFSLKVGISLVFNTPKIRDLAEKILNLLQSELGEEPAFLELEPSYSYPLSLSQEPMWIWYELIGETSAYNVPRIEHLKGRISVDLLKKSLLKIAERHQVLRSQYLMKEGRAVQMTIPFSHFSLNFQEIDLTSNVSSRKICQELIEKEINKPFSLVKGETFRSLLIHLREDECILIITMHHIVTDGSSIPLFWNELVTCYDAFGKGKIPQLPNLTHQYFNWAHWQRESYEKGRMNRSLNFWKEQMRELPEILDLPVDFPYPKEQTFNGNRINFIVEKSSYQALDTISKQENTTLFMALIAVWASFLARHTGQDEVTIGTPWVNRDLEEVQSLIGCFVNTLPLRLKVPKGISFLDLLCEAKKVSLDAFKHAEIPFHKIVEALNINSVNGRLPLYQTMIALEEENGWIQGKPFEGTCRVEKENSLYAIRDTSKFEISLSLREKTLLNEKVLCGEFVYNTDLFSDATAQSMKNRLLFFLKQLVENPERDLFSLQIASEEEIALVCDTLNQTERAFSKGETVFHLFEKQALKTPEKVALIWDDQSYSYEKLWDLVNRFSHYLIQKSIKKNDRVALLLERTPEMIVAIFSLMQCGATFVPIDPAYPVNRQEFILKDSEVKSLITSQPSPVLSLEKQIIFNQKSLFEMESFECFERPNTQDIAYLLYTSGTTGVPKGVKISHGNLFNDIIHMIEVQVPKDDFALSLFSTNIVFDQFVEELFPPLCTGNTVLLVDNAFDLSWRSFPVTFMVTTPSQMTYVLLNRVPQSVRSLVLGGELLSSALVEEIFEKTNIQRIYNSYGPTECTDQAAYCLITRERRKVSLGRPISNCKIYILDSNQNLLPQGLWGELYIGGFGVGQGYHNREELTAKHFIKLPFAEGCLYRTGDIARWNLHGEIEVRGRIDAQFKIHGVRIEKEEIEHVLKSQEGVTSAYVVKVQGKDKSETLLAYVTPENLDVLTLKENCAKFLSMHMIPEQIIPLAELPMLSSGKVDVKSLEKVSFACVKSSLKYLPDLNKDSAFEEQLKLLFQEVLKKNTISKKDSFLASGGHSLLIVQLLALIRERFGKRISMKDFLSNDNPQSLALLLQGLVKQKENPIDSSFCKMWIDPLSIPRGGTSILIIGGGIAGIMSAIECQKRGIPFQIVEKSGNFGGVWLHGCNKASRLQTSSKVYQVDSSVEHIAFYPNRSEMLTYLELIVNQYGLRKKTLFHTKVDRILKTEEGFSIEVVDERNGQKNTLYQDGILVCTGKHHVPHVPTWKIKDGAPPIIHASKLDHVDLKGKHVLIVGAGSYAIEALRLADQEGAEKVTVLSRKSYWVLPTLADSILYSGIREDLSFPEDYEKHLTQLKKWLSAHYSQLGLDHMIPRPEHQSFDAHISSCDDFFKIAQKKHVTLKIGEIDQLMERGVLLSSQEEIKADLIIAATGYKDPDLSFLDSITGKIPSVYKGFMLAADPRIGFIGFLDMVVSSTQVISLNLEMALKVMTTPLSRPSKERVLSWIQQMPEEYLLNIKSHIAWLHEEKAVLECEQGLGFLVDQWVESYGHKIALEDQCQKITYLDLLKKVQRISAHLIKRKHKTILAIIPETIQGFTVLNGILRIDATVFLSSEDQDISMFLKEVSFSLDCIITTREIYRGLSIDECKNFKDVIFLEEDLESLEEPFQRENARLQSISLKNSKYVFWTSGTTGKAKGVCHTQKSLWHAVEGFEETCCHSMKETPRLLFQNRLSHLGGFMAALCVIKSGGTLLFSKASQFPVEKEIQEYKPNLLIQMTSSFMELVSRVSLTDSLWQSLKQIVLGGESITDSEIKFLRNQCPVPVTMTYGISECGPLFKRDLFQEELHGMGKPLPGVLFTVMNSEEKEVKTGEIGELYINSPSLFSGYFAQENFHPTEFFKTKDFVQKRMDNQLIYKGRKEDLVDSKIFISDIENLILSSIKLQKVVLSHEYQNDRIRLNVYTLVCSEDNLWKRIDDLLKREYPKQTFDLHIYENSTFLRNSSGKIQRRNLKNKRRPKVVLFSGQGAQHIGMVDLFLNRPQVRKLYQRAEQILGYDLLNLCRKGPEELLNRTDICQVAIYVASIAELLSYQETDSDFLQDCQMAGGLSLGEYTALTASGSISFEDGLRVLALRGKLMQEASSCSSQVMISLNLLPKARIERLLREHQEKNSVYLATDLHPYQCVIAGERSVCMTLSKQAEVEGAVATVLRVSGAFHTPYMSPAVAKLAEALYSIEFKDPLFPILSNVTALPCSHPEQLRKNLIQQLDHPVQFSSSLSFLEQRGFVPGDFLEIGPKKIITNIVKSFFNQKKMERG